MGAFESDAAHIWALFGPHGICAFFCLLVNNILKGLHFQILLEIRRSSNNRACILTWQQAPRADAHWSQPVLSSCPQSLPLPTICLVLIPWCLGILATAFTVVCLQ